jgi:chromosome segregation ATPase
MRELLQSAIDGLTALLARYDEAAAAIESLGSVTAQLLSVRAAHEEALAELASEERRLEALRAERATREASVKVVRAKVAALIDEAEAKRAEIEELRQYHDELLASIAALKRRLAA